MRPGVGGWARGRFGWIGFAGARCDAVSRLPYDVRVPESRSAGAIRSDGVAAEIEQIDDFGMEYMFVDRQLSGQLRSAAGIVRLSIKQSFTNSIRRARLEMGAARSRMGCSQSRGTSVYMF